MFIRHINGRYDAKCFIYAISIIIIIIEMGAISSILQINGHRKVWYISLASKTAVDF